MVNDLAKIFVDLYIIGKNPTIWLKTQQKEKKQDLCGCLVPIVCSKVKIVVFEPDSFDAI